MITRAPGKLVVSGAYSVLEGAPAIVTAVDRYATVDTSREPAMITREVAAAIDLGFLERPFHFDASELRSVTEHGDHKLGLGSSAAILAATLAAHHLASRSLVPTGATLDPALTRRIHGEADAAHRRAQEGGSGVDVAAATFGGTLRFTRASPSAQPRIEPWIWPPGARLTAWTTHRPAVTSDLRKRVEDLRESAREVYEDHVGEAGRFAEIAAHATDLAVLVPALLGQLRSLRALGRAAGAPIVDDPTWVLAGLAEQHGSFFGPSGAGGGDICIYIASSPPPLEWVRLAHSYGLSPLELSVGARGIHTVDESLG